MNPFRVFSECLEFLDSHKGRLERRKAGWSETDSDIAVLLPNKYGKTIVTIGDLRKIVEAGKELQRLKERLP